MDETFGTVAQKRDYYLQILQKARELNDQILVRLTSKKLALLGMTAAVSTKSGCMIIPFPNANNLNEPVEYERPSWWLLFKLALAVLGSLVALLLLAFYRYGPGVSGVY